jgi:hypothetical protein
MIVMRMTTMGMVGIFLGATDMAKADTADIMAEPLMGGLIDALIQKMPGEFSSTFDRASHLAVAK